MSFPPFSEMFPEREERKTLLIFLYCKVIGSMFNMILFYNTSNIKLCIKFRFCVLFNSHKIRIKCISLNARLKALKLPIIIPNQLLRRIFIIPSMTMLFFLFYHETFLPMSFDTFLQQFSISLSSTSQDRNGTGLRLIGAILFMTVLFEPMA